MDEVALVEIGPPKVGLLDLHEKNGIDEAFDLA